MKVYLAFKDSNTMMEGYFEQVVGVFDSEDKAWAFLKTTSDFEYSNPSKNGKYRVYHFDGELSHHWRVMELELNKPIHEEGL